MKKTLLITGLIMVTVLSGCGKEETKEVKNFEITEDFIEEEKIEEQVIPENIITEDIIEEDYITIDGIEYPKEYLEALEFNSKKNVYFGEEG